MKKGRRTEDFTDLEQRVACAQKGDKKAMETLLLAFKPMLWSVAGQYVYDKNELEDAYQEACTVFIEGVRDFVLEARVYFQVFIRQRLIHYFKKRREGRFSRSLRAEDSLDRLVAGEGGVIALAELIVDEGACVEQAFMRQEHTQACARAFKRLTPWQQEILRCRYQERESLIDLGRRRGVSPAAVTQAYDRAVAIMKREL